MYLCDIMDTVLWADNYVADRRYTQVLCVLFLPVGDPNAFFSDWYGEADPRYSPLFSPWAKGKIIYMAIWRCGALFTKCLSWEGRGCFWRRVFFLKSYSGAKTPTPLALNAWLLTANIGHLIQYRWLSGSVAWLHTPWCQIQERGPRSHLQNDCPP